MAAKSPRKGIGRVQDMLKRLWLVSLLCIALAAIGWWYAENSGSGSVASPSVSPGEPGKASQAASRTFGIIYPMAHPFYEMITRNANDAAAAQGVRLIVKAPDEANLEQQIRMMETMIAQKVDGIAIDPVDPVAIIPAINKAAQAGIPVICFESDSPGSNRLAFIGADNRKAGEKMGKLLDELLDGQGMVIVESGMSRMTSLSDRLDGLLDYFHLHTAIDVLEVRYNEGNEATALSSLESMIDAHPHFDAFVALDVMSGSASILVWKASGLDRFALTFGMMPDIQSAIENGQISAVVSQNEQDWGERIVKRLLDASEGRTVVPFDDTGITEIISDTLSMGASGSSMQNQSESEK